MKEDTRKKRIRTKAKKADEPVEKEEKNGFFSSRIGIVLIAVVGLAFIIYTLITLSGIHGQIRELTDELDDIEQQIVVQEIKNKNISKTSNMSASERDEYMERIARDELDYVKDGERVFVNVAGE